MNQDNVINNDPELNAKYAKRHKGWFCVKNDNYYTAWMMNRISPGRTRVGFVAWMTPRAYVPRWLYRLIVRIELPGVLEDLEKALGELE